MVLGNLNLVAEECSCRTSLKAAGVGDKIKKEWRKVKKVRKDRLLGIRQGKDGFQDGGMGEVDAGFAGDIQGTKQLREALKRTEQTRFRWQWSECFREDERDRKTNTE
jgi:hypothetical protein